MQVLAEITAENSCILDVFLHFSTRKHRKSSNISSISSKIPLNPQASLKTPLNPNKTLNFLKIPFKTFIFPQISLLYNQKIPSVSHN